MSSRAGAATTANNVLVMRFHRHVLRMARLGLPLIQPGLQPH